MHPVSLPTRPGPHRGDRLPHATQEMHPVSLPTRPGPHRGDRLPHATVGIVLPVLPLLKRKPGRRRREKWETRRKESEKKAETERAGWRKDRHSAGGSASSASAAI